MESALILEGCLELENEHDIRVDQIIADGCSDVYINLVINLSYGENIIKVECINHIMKNYIKFLYKFLG